ncbi:NAD(P)/FAD-dependent oxidoreductase [Leekyejoonella antrihumi]|uniref:FAD-binding oxidoreductase n=1 Tax=Leekyejoonella antrihumi TaxID=1660198 RepID=A0A563DUT2_9MICO|nr:FAD-binding oxidoreductase [Leekyejoonella antrihumi]TWP33693.1 FAD-binding oxidoreductase [Leekyejoonella antrihumi]
MSDTADVVVVGAGVIGAASALELAKTGLRVLVVDKAGGAGLGSTSASSAVVRFNYSTWDAVATAWESKHCWEKWSEHLRIPDNGGLATFVRVGMVMLDVPPMPRDHIMPLFDLVGVPYEEWDAAELRARVPGIDTGRYWPPKRVDDEAFFAETATKQIGALYTPDGGFIDDAQLAAQNLATAAGAAGAEFLFNRAVTGIDRHAGRVSAVKLSDGTQIATRVLVNVAGPWSSEINRMAGVGGEFTVGVRPMRQEVHQVAAPPGYNRPSGLGPAIADMDLGTYMRPDGSGFLLIGGTEPACDPLEWIDDPDRANPRPTASRFQAQVTRAARRLPGLTVPNAPTGIAGVYDVADDWTPIYDRTDLDGFYVAIGTSGNQFKNAPLAGRFLATIIDGVEAGHDHDRDPLRYTCEHTGHVINLGAFSRKRTPNNASSGTVMG